MKKLVISVLLVILFVLSAGIANAEEKKADDKKFKPPKVLDPEKIRRERRPARQRERHNRRDRTSRLREKLQKIDEGIGIKESEHRKFIDELVSIKNLAIKEKANKTAKRLEALIEAKSAEFDEAVQKLNESRDKYREMLAPSGAKPAERIRPTKVPTKPAEQGKKEDAKEGKAKWWQFWK